MELQKNAPMELQTESSYGATKTDIIFYMPLPWRVGCPKLGAENQ